MSERYASARTYRDEATLHDRIGDAISVTRIRTLWVAPDQMRFEALTEHDKFFDPERIVIVSRAGSTRSLFLGEVRVEPSLDDALGAMQGVSRGMTGLAPRWLLERGCRLAARYVLDGQEPCGAATCFKLVGELPGRTVTLDIDTQSFALRRYRSRGILQIDEATARQRIEAMPAEARARRGDNALLESLTQPSEVETDLVVDPVFDSSIAPAELGQLTP
ncbi:MAG: hypothetical protein KF901_34390 [Myxococcales bacterium]|nr:hypothetical protein [Myxococcales bacterium]